MNLKKNIIASIDQGTSSSRFLVFSAEDGQQITFHQIEINKTYPHEGWVEQCPREIYQTVAECIDNVVTKLPSLGYSVENIACVGLTNQRESTILWNKVTGEPLYNSIVWLDNRSSELVDTIIDKIPGRNLNYLKSRTGLPISTYFSALKIKWLFENIPEVSQCHDRGELLFGTVDCWLLWKLTGEHQTDVTNASRTLLMNLETLEWDSYLCDFFRIPMDILPKIRSSGDFFGAIKTGSLAGVPITAVIGDQNAALVGQKCLKVGQAKVTYGTGAFLMQNIGSGSLHGALADVPKEARHKLITTVGYKLTGRSACYALEGSIAIAGAAITWLRDNLELIDNYGEVESLAGSDQTDGNLCFVPAFQGLYAPYWDPAATGIIIGISQFTKRSHLIRATIEGVAFQTNDILALMSCREDQIGITTHGIRVDGGMSENNLLCQTLADISGIDIIRPKFTETTAFGAAMLAAHTASIWPELGATQAVEKSQENYQARIRQEVNLIDHNENLVEQENQSLANQAIEESRAFNGDHNRRRRTSSTASELFDSACSYLCSSIHSILHPSNYAIDVHGLQVKPPALPILSIEEIDPTKYTLFRPSIALNTRSERINTWREAVRRCRKWVRVEQQEQKRSDYLKHSTLPISIFILVSVAMCVASSRY